jgi:hypothetical protein
MERISNDKFLLHARKLFSQDDDLIDRFYISLKMLNDDTAKRTSHSIDIDNNEFINILHHAEVYINLTRIKFIDLYTGYICCINSKSYGSAIHITRSIIENVAMLDFVSTRLIKQLEERDYIKVVKELLTFSVPSWETHRVKDYKRIHISDALRHMSKGLFNSNSKIFDVYDPMSEMVHPSATSFLVYINKHGFEKNKIQHHYSRYDVKDTFLDFTASGLLYADLLVHRLYPQIIEKIIDKINKSYFEINTLFNTDHELRIEYENLIDQLTPDHIKSEEDEYH